MDYHQRGEYLFTYESEDSSGNKAHTVQFAVIMEDTTPPVIDGNLTSLDIDVESLSKFQRYYTNPVLEAIKSSDTYDGVLPVTITMAESFGGVGLKGWGWGLPGSIHMN